MAINQFPLPDLGEGLTEGEILKWLVAEGDVIELNQPIVEVETAKAAVEIPAKWAGTVVKIFVPEGTVVEVGSPIISIDTGGPSAPVADDMSQGAAAQAEKAAEATGGLIGETTASGRTAVLVGYGPRVTAAKRRARKDAPAAPAPVAAAPVAAAPAPAVPAPAAPVAVAPAAPAANGHGVLAKPPVRMLARTLGVDLSTLTGTGPQGSITRDDVQAALAAPAAAPSTRVVITPGARETRIPIKGVRKLTAANMVASAFTAPHVTEFLTVDMTRSMKALERLKADREWRDVRVSPLLLVAKAVLLAARRHPMVNSSWDEAAQEIVVKDYVNLGIAAATERGLIVPNIADAGRLSLRELADAMTDLVATAKSGKTPPSAMSGGTFTITNVGVFGVDTGTPILPPGEAAILAFGAVRETPWAHKGKVKLRQVTTLGLSFDHRIIDGELGSKFLRDIGAFLADPEAMFLAWT
ncbi:dihydrolipoamide acetyltransferase family protein [Catellatospora citrea]|uniref:Dihydrolipoamide acetyltransferase component of pyruvate dehydrogenase complex n=1 Tax=Catellatospora citrea TaxID=53366 RepID=A0A8J3P2W6_9ACTN|nr:dihydrolipoamide acetyltransferase family protein [Catellatospora citrea]RKE08973.1 pyruvate dehydrogenase E2 component (dihydrolipoamide acetyltransferase) [Catellatospora citrea]GIG01879.1 dihydrolipoamide acetyltransferase component of pyruvate dehydrogenase complex [Catellatospora citrea]